MFFLLIIVKDGRSLGYLNIISGKMMRKRRYKKKRKNKRRKKRNSKKQKMPEGMC